MMTCVSDRSGNASSGVESVAWMPQAASKAVAISTRKRFWIDQRMRDSSMSVPPVRRLHRRTRHQLRFRGLRGRFGCTGEDVEGPPQNNLGDHEELPRRTNILAKMESFQNLRSAAVLGTHAHQHGAKMCPIVGDDDDATGAGLDDRFARYGERLLLRGALKMHCGKHAGPQELARIADDDAHFQCPRVSR